VKLKHMCDPPVSECYYNRAKRAATCNPHACLQFDSDELYQAPFDVIRPHTADRHPQRIVAIHH